MRLPLFVVVLALSSASAVAAPVPLMWRGGEAMRIVPVNDQKPPGSVAHGRITGYTSHGAAQAMGRDGGVGVKPSAILDAARNPREVRRGVNAEGRPYISYQGRDARVVTNNQGKIVTAHPTGRAGVRNPPPEANRPRTRR